METGTASKSEEAAASPVTPMPPPYQPNYGTTDNAPPPVGGADTQPIYSDEPPSYDSLFGQVQAARATSSSHADFFKKFVVILLNTIFCTAMVALLLLIPISMLVIGVRYLHDCPCQRYIPIYLIVSGCFGIVRNLYSLIARIRNSQQENSDENSKAGPLDSLVSCFLFAWFIAGNVWVYGSYSDVDFEDGDNYCNPVLYWFAFWMITSLYILMALGCCCVMCTGCISWFFPNSINRHSAE